MPKLIDHDRRREELVRALWRIVTARGIGAVSIREVAKEAGVATGSLRHVFPTRDELVIAAAEQMLTNVTARVGAVSWNQPPLDAIEQILCQTLPLDDERRVEFAVNLALVAEEPAVPALADIRLRTYSALRELCLTVVQQLRPTAGAEEVDHLGRRLHLIVDGLAFHLFQDRDATAWALDTVRAELRTIAAVGG